MPSIKETAMEYLLKEPLLHMDMTENLRRGGAEILHASEKGVLLLKSGAYFISARDGAAARHLLSFAGNADLFNAHQSHCARAVAEKYRYPRKIVCHQAAYLEKEPLKAEYPAEIRPLDESFLAFIMENYTHADDEKYIRNRLQTGNLFGAFEEGNLAGFIGVHDEGSIGFLEVLPQYRRRGLAVTLAVYLTNHFLERGQIPFSQIETFNTASLRLHQKLRYTVSEQKIWWLMNN